jgi:HEAT repeat protein
VSPRRWGLGLGAVALIGGATLLPGQGGLRSRVEAGGDGRVQFRYAARADVCGAGGAIAIGRSTFISTGGSSGFDGFDRMACRRGPIVARVPRSGGQVVGVEVEIAPEEVPQGVTDLGMVGAGAAAEYLLDLAARADGRPAREAILPAVLADSAVLWPGLLRLAHNRDLSRSVRQSAISWLGRELDRMSADDARKSSAAIVEIASDAEETLPIRQQAVSVLARSQRADLTTLTRMANGNDSWLRQAAVQALANSGDPRAREFLRNTLQDTGLPEPLRVTVIRGLGRDYATARDLELLRSRYPAFASTEAKQAVLSVMGEQGGGTNLQWLLGIAGDPSTAPELRARAMEAAQRAGAGSAQIGELYERASDRRGKEAAINALFKNGDRAAVDKLIHIARTETDLTVRRSLINRLGRLPDERVKSLLKELVGEP